MSDCCSTSISSSNSETNTEIKNPKKHSCPVNGKQYSEVSPTTILHHLNEPWNWTAKQQGYYFCTDPDCDVVYFGEDDSLILKSELRTKVGLKELNDEALVCYCFGVTKSQATDERIKDFVIKSTKEKTCACTTRNPSGKCCLKDFPK